MLRLEGAFRIYLEKSIRVDDDCDWSPHTVDYVVFKQMLKKLCSRRYEIRSMLRRSPDGKLSTDVVAEALGTSVLVDLPEKDLDKPASGDQRDIEADEAVHNNYINLLEMEGIGRVDSSFSSTRSDKKPSRKSRVSVLRNLSFLERKELVAFLKSELEKAQMFYLAQWQRISVMVEHKTPEDKDYHVVGDEVLELVAFCVINVVTVCQCLIRYDAFARTFEGTPMMDYWVKHNTRFSTPFRKILQHEELVALANTYAENVQELSLLEHFDAQRKMFAETMSSTRTAQVMASSGHMLFRDSVVQTLRSGFLMGSYVDRLGLEPSYLMMRGQSLTQEIRKLVEWREKKHEMLPSPRMPKKQLTGVQVFNLTLNLLSAFLYCMNYYIVEPSSTMYVNRLGAFDAMSGTLIGMVPLAAFASSIPFSMWTNTSFRSPFILSCFLLLIGNIVYSVADQFRDVRIALLGRFLVRLVGLLLSSPRRCPTKSRVKFADWSRSTEMHH